MIFVHHAIDKRGKERANVYRGALQMAFDRGVEAERLPSLIFQEGGIDKAYRTALKLKRSGKATPSEQDLPSSGKASDTKAEQGGAEEEQLSGSAELSSGADNRSLPFDGCTTSTLMRKMANIVHGGYEPMLVALQPHDLHKVIGRYVETGEVSLRCKLVRDDDDGWVEVTCMKAWRNHRKP